MSLLATRLLTLTGLLLLWTSSATAQEVTFQLDANALIEACQFGPDSQNPDSFLSLRGSFNEYAENSHVLTDEDGDGVYSVTLTIAPGDYNYKFYHSELGWEDGVEGSTHQDGNRQVTVTETATLDPVTFNKPFENICGQQSTEVTFQLDASDLIAACHLGPDSADPDATVSVPGSFNSFTPGELVLTDEDGDGVYTATIDLFPGDYEYKFYHSTLAWEDGNNRQFSVSGTDPITLDVGEYNKSFSSVCGATLQCVDVFFRVNMGPQIASGEFDPTTDIVTVAGPHNGWNTTADTLTAETRDPNIYSTLVQLEEQAVPGEVEHKFVTSEGGEQNGWESINGNRFLTITGDEEDLDGNGCIDVEADPVPFFNNTDFTDLFSQDATVTIELDLRPAYYFLADSTYVPGNATNSPLDRLDGFESVFVNGPIAGGWEDNWSPTGLGSLESRRLVDDGTNGDAVAGDSIFTWQTEMTAGASRSTVFKFGLDGFDNENPMGADHRIQLADEADVRTRVVFGAAYDGEDEYVMSFYDPYIEIVDGSPVVVRRGGATSVEPVGPDAPHQMALDANFPNPFAGSTAFEYHVPRSEHVTVAVFDVVGREVARLVDEVQSAGSYRATFDATGLASGVYVYQLRTPTESITRRMLLTK